MKTISALELRKNMAKILSLVDAGEEFVVTYRNSKPIRLISENKLKTKRASTGLDKLNSSPKKNFKFDQKKSIKELYEQSLGEKHG